MNVSFHISIVNAVLLFLFVVLCMHPHALDLYISKWHEYELNSGLGSLFTLEFYVYICMCFSVDMSYHVGMCVCVTLTLVTCSHRRFQTKRSC